MVRLYPSEVFKQFSMGDRRLKNYAISNFGRLLSYTQTMDDGEIIRASVISGIHTWRYRSFVDGKFKNSSVSIAKLVVMHFLPPPAEDQTFVLYLDYDHEHLHVRNVKWATRAEMQTHYNKNPNVLAARKNLQPRLDGTKLTSTQVIRLKKRLQDPNRKTRLKMLAKEFGVSEMQISRIKNGGSWGHLKV